MFQKFPFLLSSLVLLVLLTSACAPAAMPIPATATTPPAMQPTQAVQQPTQAAVPVTGGQTINVNETEFKLDMPSTVKAGAVTFNVSNKGSIPHSLEIQGQGIDQKLPTVLQPGQSGTLQVTLTAGTYTVFCPVDGHKDQGMTTSLTVQ